MDFSYNDFKLTHLLNISGKTSEDNWAIEEVAASLNLPMTFIITNVRSLWKSLHKHTNGYTNLGAAYALRKLIKTYYYSTSYDLSKFTIKRGHRADTDQYLLLLAKNFTTPDFNVLMGGMPANRHEKIMAISDYEIVQKNLSVCISSIFNCSVCWKCKRSLMEFEMLGVLDNYREVFDVDYYLNNKIEYFGLLYIRKSFDELTKPIYNYFLQKEPELLIRAEKQLFEDVENLSDADFKNKYGVKNPMVDKKRLRKQKSMNVKNPAIDKKRLRKQKSMNINKLKKLYKNLSKKA